jgi:hypothetical protein
VLAQHAQQNGWPIKLSTAELQNTLFCCSLLLVVMLSLLRLDQVEWVALDLSPNHSLLTK